MSRPRKATAETPLMKQYREIKSRHTNAILFFRMGDFYEMFYGDAEIGARELGLTLTTRNNGGAANVPLAGVPVKAATEYLRKLVEGGYRVAICEQVEDPKLAKGLVRREVVETVTPGAVLQDGWLDRARNNFLVAVLPDPQAGVAAIDLSTGEFLLETVPIEDLATTMQRLDAREMVVPSGKVPDLPQMPLITEREPWEFDAQAAREEITRRFELASLDGLGIEERDQPSLAAAGALLRYAAELQPGGLPQLSRPLARRGGSTMVVDEMTARNLELVDSLRPEQSAATLLQIIDFTLTPMGARLQRQWILAPLRSVDLIRERHDAVEVLLKDGRGRAQLREALDGVRDVERLASRCASRRASPRDLASLRDSLRRLPNLLGAVDGLRDRDHSARLMSIAAEFDLLEDLTGELVRYLADSPPPSIGEGDAIRRGADSELDEARELRDGGKRLIAALQTRERDRTGIKSLRVGFNRVFGYYIQVTKANKGSLPSDYERRQTLANAERYVTPELKEYEAKIFGAEERASERERELLDRLSQQVQEQIERVQRTAKHIGETDVIASFAEAAARNNYTRPAITDGFSLVLKQCRHPVVEQMLPQGKFIPNDVSLDAAGRVVLLTGPNMAGKSTILRQVGLAVIMAHAGSFVPAAAAEIGIIDRVFTRVGASDSLGRAQSTFMVEMNETSAIVHGASERSLVLLDEIGRGTSTFDGVAIAWAVTEHLHDRTACKTIFATHYHELTQLTEELEHARNFNVAVKEVGEDIVFLYRLKPGGSDRSYGIHVARLAGLPTAVVERARQVLALLESGHHVAGKTAPPTPDRSQLPLFAGSHPVLQELRDVDPNTMTPLEALARLADLKSRLENS